jgi:hypothetical protein
MLMNEKRFLNVKDLCDYIDVSESYVDKSAI